MRNMEELIRKEEAVDVIEKVMNTLKNEGKSEQAKGAYQALKAVVAIKAVMEITELERLLSSENKTEADKRFGAVVYSFKHSGITYELFSSMTGISKSTLQRYITGAIKKVPYQALDKMETALLQGKCYIYPYDIVPDDGEPPL